MRKIIFIVMLITMAIGVDAQRVKVFNGTFQWGDVEVTKQLKFYSNQDLTIEHIKVVTEDDVELYNRDVTWNFNHLGDVVTISMSVVEPLKNFIEKLWNIYVTYKEGEETHTARYRLMHTTMHDLFPHKLSDGIFVPFLGVDGEELGTTTAVSKITTPRDRFEIYKVGIIEIKNGKKYIIKD